jgi:hypothetical protein
VDRDDVDPRGEAGSYDEAAERPLTLFDEGDVGEHNDSSLAAGGSEEGEKVRD